MIIVDVWGGDRSMDHVARFIRSVDDALMIARRELDAGYLVNLRKELEWGEFKDFDLRVQH